MKFQIKNNKQFKQLAKLECKLINKPDNIVNDFQS